MENIKKVTSFHYPESVIEHVPVFVRTFEADHVQEPIIRMNGADMHQWIYCASGQGVFYCGNESYRILEGDAIFIAANTPHAYHAETDRQWITHFIGFTGNNCVQIMNTLGITETSVYHVADKALFSNNLQNMQEIYESDCVDKVTALSKVCYGFLLDLSLCVERVFSSALTLNSDINPLVPEMIRYINANYAGEFSIDNMAEHFNITKEYCCVVFKKNTNQTIIDYLNGYRIFQARVLLGQYPSRTVAEIAHACGFENASYFTKVFRRLCKMTPKEYRMSLI